MFSVKVDKSKYKVQFRHIETDLSERVTYCTISNGNGVEADGYACANGNFDRNKNRKDAMAMALQQKFPRGLREPFWNKYFEVRHGQY